MAVFVSLQQLNELACGKQVDVPFKDPVRSVWSFPGLIIAVHHGWQLHFPFDFIRF